jgi:hypothetical protein
MMDDDGIPIVVPHDPFAAFAAALTDLASESCRGDVAERQLCEVLQASVKQARPLLAVRPESADGPLAQAIALAERRITNLIGGISSGHARERAATSDLM